MTFQNTVRFPDTISRGVVFGPEFVTEIASMPNGTEFRNQVRTRALMVGECSHAVKTQTQLTELNKFFRSMGGRTHSFRFKDWSDFSVTQDMSKLVSISPNVYQLAKSYSITAGFEEVRYITKPITAGLQVFLNAAALTISTNYTFVNSTGIVTFTSRGNRNVTGVTVGATTVITLNSAISGMLVGHKLKINGVTGADASLLNGLEHTITVVASNVYTISTNTTGKTITPAGTADWMYGGSPDTLTWSGDFDVPVRFDTDRMATKTDVVGVYTWDQIPIREVPE